MFLTLKTDNREHTKRGGANAILLTAVLSYAKIIDEVNKNGRTVHRNKN
jgi:hypothetical protein